MVAVAQKDALRDVLSVASETYQRRESGARIQELSIAADGSGADVDRSQKLDIGKTDTAQGPVVALGHERVRLTYWHDIAEVANDVHASLLGAQVAQARQMLTPGHMFAPRLCRYPAGTAALGGYATGRGH